MLAFLESCPRCDACGKRMESWSYTQTGIKFCDKTCRSKIEKIMDWYERDNVSNTPFKSYVLSKADLHEQTKILSTLAFLLLATGVDEPCIEVIIRKVCTTNIIKQQDFQFYMRKAYSISLIELKEGMSLIANDVCKYYYAQLLLLTGFCNGMEEHLKTISEVLSVLELTKYEIRFLCNRTVEHLNKVL